MEIIKAENLSFSYPGSEKKALENINISINSGEFITVCGQSGCGKTTFLRLLKNSLSPHGNMEGKIFFENKPIEDMSSEDAAIKTGFVMQDCDNQIVSDTVWHELAFGLENIGTDVEEMRIRIAEMATFFGISKWFYKKTSELSGGQKQLLNLASVMVMQPSVLILDEPTSQLDPIYAQEFLKILERINKELGTTVIMTEHRLEDAFGVSDRVVVLDNGRIIADAKPADVGFYLKQINHEIFKSFPTPMKVYCGLCDGRDIPLNVRDGKAWLERFVSDNGIECKEIKKEQNRYSEKTVAVELRDVWFRYKKDLPDILKGLKLKAFKGEFLAILGGNGVGKSTTVSVLSGLNIPYNGKVLINGRKLSEISDLYNGILGILPQNPEALFVKKSIREDLFDMILDKKENDEKKEEWIKNIASLCKIEKILDKHPYDISGGERQRAALAKILLKNPDVLVLDEPTKGMDSGFKEIFAEIIYNLKQNGTTVIMVSHDLEFCAKYADRCALMFGGEIMTTEEPNRFFSGKNFYTTSANRMSRGIVTGAVLAEDIIFACNGSYHKKELKFYNLNLPEKENINTKTDKKIFKKLD